MDRAEATAPGRLLHSGIAQGGGGWGGGSGGRRGGGGSWFMSVLCLVIVQITEVPGDCISHVWQLQPAERKQRR